MILKNGSTSVTTYIVLRDSTDHAPKTDVTLTDIDLYYVEQGAAISNKTDMTALAAADSAFSANKGYHVGQGLYRIDWPDTAFDGGAGKKVVLIVVCAGVDTEFLSVELSPDVNANSITAGAIAMASLNADLKTGSAIKANVETVTAGAFNLAAFNADAKTGSALKANVETVTANALTASALATDAVTEIVTAILAAAIEAAAGGGNITLRQSLAISNAFCSGKDTGGGTGSITFKNPADTKARISGTLDANKNRTAVTLDFSDLV